MLKKLALCHCWLVAVTFAAAPHAQSRFTLKVHTGRGQIGYDVNSTMVIGEKDILLIDPQFSLSEAHKLAAEILESKKHLATIYSTHPHPDHLFGLAVLKQAFPGREDRGAAGHGRRRRRPAGRRGRNSGLPTYGTNIPGPDPVLPEELATPVLTLEGEQFPITGGVQGADGPGNSFVLHPVAESGRHRRHRVRSGLLRRAARRGTRELDEDRDSDRRAQSGDRHSRARRSGRHARHARDRVDEEVHRRLGRERGEIEDAG